MQYTEIVLTSQSGSRQFGASVQCALAVVEHRSVVQQSELALDLCLSISCSLRLSMAAPLQRSFRRLVCHTLHSNFREATKIETVPLPSVGPTEVLVKNLYVGINASDVNFVAGTAAPL